jgi:preprotein translocase subunit SecG
MKWIDYIILVVAILVIFVVIIQDSDEDGMSAFSGQSSDLFKKKKLRGQDLFFARATAILTIAFVVLIIVSNSLVRW